MFLIQFILISNTPLLFSFNFYLNTFLDCSSSMFAPPTKWSKFFLSLKAKSRDFSTSRIINLSSGNFFIIFFSIISVCYGKNKKGLSFENGRINHLKYNPLLSRNKIIVNRKGDGFESSMTLKCTPSVYKSMLKYAVKTTEA